MATRNVQQSGNVTPTHLATWRSDGAIQDGGPLPVPIPTIGVTKGVFFDTRANAAAATIVNTALWVQTAGLNSAGDGSGALYFHAASLVSGGFQSADGQFWQPAAGSGGGGGGNSLFLNVVTFGADPTGVADSTAAFNAAITQAVMGAVQTNGPEIYAIGNFTIGNLTDPGSGNQVVIKVWGSLTLTSTLILLGNISIIGLGGAAPPPQFTVTAASCVIYGPSSGADAVRFHGQSHQYMANVVVKSGAAGQVPVHLDGTTPGLTGSLCRLDNVVAQTFTAGTTPALLIENWFWFWAYRTRWLSGSGSNYSIQITNNAAHPTIGAGIIYFDDLICSSGGILINSATSGTPSGIYFREMSIENLIANGMVIDASFGECTDITIDGYVEADATGAGGLVLQNGLFSNIRLLGANSFKRNITVTNAIVTGMFMDGVSTMTAGQVATMPRQIVSNIGDFTTGAPLTIGDTMAPALSPVAPLNLNLAGQDASGWPAAAASQANGINIGYGVTAPDGSPTAATISTANAGQTSFQYDQRSITPAVGDYAIFGGWLQNRLDKPTVQMHLFALRLIWSNASVTWYTTGAAPTTSNVATPGDADESLQFWSQGSWVGYVGIARVSATPGGAQTLTFETRTNSAVPTIAAWHPFLYYIAAGTLPTDELIRLYQSIRRGPILAQAGDIALLDHQKLMLGGGVRIDSRSAQPVKYLYRVGDRTFNTTAAGGWTCTTAGGAFSAVRNASTPTTYTVGTWIQWSTGVTVVECTIAGTNSGGALAAPTTVGQVVVDGSVTWVCRSLASAAFSASL